MPTDGPIGAAIGWPGHVPLTRPYITNGLNQYTTSGGVALRYDGRGNLNVSGTATYSYDGLNRLYGTNGGVTIGYDPAQNRVDAYTVNSASTYLYYAGSALTAETNGTSITQRYVPGPGTDEPIVWYSGGTTAGREFLQADERGSIIAVTNSAGAITGHNSYDEFGIPAAGNVGRFQYTGQTWFPEVGLYYYKARWYSPTLGRFMQTDPIGYGDGLNFYNYAGSDPVNGSDPNGLEHAPDPPNTIHVHNDPGSRPSPRPGGSSTGQAGQNAGGGGNSADDTIVVTAKKKKNKKNSPAPPPPCQDPFICKAESQPQSPCNVSNNFCGPVPKVVPPLTPKQRHDQACSNYSSIGKIATYSGGAGLVASLLLKANPYTAAASGLATAVGVGAQAAADLSGC